MLDDLKRALAEWYIYRTDYFDLEKAWGDELKAIADRYGISKFDAMSVISDDFLC